MNHEMFMVNAHPPKNSDIVLTPEACPPLLRPLSSTSQKGRIESCARAPRVSRLKELRGERPLEHFLDHLFHRGNGVERYPFADVLGYLFQVPSFARGRRTA